MNKVFSGTKTLPNGLPRKVTCRVSSTLISTAARSPTWLCLVAAQRGHLSCLKFLHESDCPWDERIIGEALWEDQALCAMYALLQGCPCIDHVDILSIM